MIFVITYHGSHTSGWTTPSESIHVLTTMYICHISVEVIYNTIPYYTTRAKRRWDFHNKSSFSNGGFMKMQQLISQLCQQEHYICILFLVLCEFLEILLSRRCLRVGPGVLTFDPYQKDNFYETVKDPQVIKEIIRCFLILDNL